MGYEVEMKFRAPGRDALMARLAAIGAEGGPPVEQEDLYLAHPGRDFAQTNEALRIRRDGPVNRVTYKGPKHAGPTKTREEIEVRFADGADEAVRMLDLFRSLGFRPVATVRKVRTTYHVEREGRALEVALDAAEGLGDFAEVEALADALEALPEAQAAVLALAGELALSDPEPRSYLRMVLENAASNPAGQT